MGEEDRYATDWLPDDERAALLERVPASAVVLDVGCWAGAAGRRLIETRSATVDGVEPDRNMADRAANAYRRVVAAPIEQVLQQGDLDGASYDVVLLMDVLEHLADPWSVLSQLRGLMRPDGRALISLPNVAHWSVRKELVRGRWRYTGSGLLDRTHLRFFTPATARELVVAAGWTVSWQSSTVAHPRLRRLPEPLRRVLRRLPTLFAMQVLIDARPAR